MAHHRLRGSASIVGIGKSGFGEAPGRSHLEIGVEAAMKALDDAGLSLADVDGLYTTNMGNFYPGPSTLEYLGIRPRHTDSTMLGGASFVHYVISASMALDAGLCDVALICYGSNQRTASGKLVSMSEPPMWEAPFKVRYPIAAYALAAARHAHEFGTTREQMAEVAVAARRWAALNPEAFARGPLTIGDVLKSRMVCDPISALDCCLVTDGGGALVMVRPDRAKDLRRRPVHFLGGATAVHHRAISQMPSLTTTSAADSGRRAYAMAGVGPADIDVALLYDAFTINTILFLEDLGFCKKGEGGSFVSGGRIAPGGALPVNTNGGGLSCVHPGMYGIFTVIEAVEQLRGAAGARQVEGAETAICHGNGGTFTAQVTAILGADGTR